MENLNQKNLIILPKTSPVNQETAECLHNILEFAPAADYRENLLEIWQQYVIDHHDAFPLNFKECAENVFVLQDFFRRIS